MKSFPEQLLAARKASGMTQEQLAEQLNVSRPMISHWETGRSLPDFETVKRLSQLLNYNFMYDDGPELLEERQPSSVQEGKAPRKTGYFYAFLSGIAVTVVVVYLFILSERPQINADPPPLPIQTPTVTKLMGTLAMDNNMPPLVEINPIEWYRQPNERIEGQAYLSIYIDENPLRLIRSDAYKKGYGWEYDLYVQEENGIDFTVTGSSTAFFYEGVGPHIYEYDADRVASWWGSNIIPAHGKQRTRTTVGFDDQRRMGVGIILTGTDAGGNERAFHYYIEFSQEVSP